MLNRQARFAPRNGHSSDWQLCADIVAKVFLG
jgi:hypothetical protein